MTREERILAQREQITYWLEYFKDNKMEHGDLELQDRLKEFITSMLGMQLDEMGISLDDVDVEIETNTMGNTNGSYSHNVSVKDGELVREKNPLYEFNLANRLEELENDQPQIRVKAIRTLSNTIFHESRHHRQHLMIEKNISSKDTIMYAREYLIASKLKGTFYERNYSYLAIEADANKVAKEEYLNIRDDKELGRLITIDRMKLATGRYTFEEVDSILERDELEYFVKPYIDNDKDAKWSIKYPVLQKQYNMDGSYKSSIDLFQNMNSELQTFCDNTQLTEEEKQKMIKECKEMYYELIYHALLIDSPEQLKQFKEVGEEKVKSLFVDMSNYFQQELETKIHASEEYTKVCKDYPENKNGIVKVIDNGEEVILSIDEFIKTFDFGNMSSKYQLPENNNLEVNAEELVKKHIIQYIPESGYVISCNNNQRTAKEFVEFALQTLLYVKRNCPNGDYGEIMKIFLEKAIMPTKWVKHTEEKSRLEEYYGEKREVLSELLEELFEQEKGIEEPSALLKSAVIATEEGTRTEGINQQLQCMMELEENKVQEKVGMER